MENTGRLEQLRQLLTATWDGDLIDKTDRAALVDSGLAIQKEGWNLISAEGIKCLVDLGILKP
jgi:hypothetical protein